MSVKKAAVAFGCVLGACLLTVVTWRLIEGEKHRELRGLLVRLQAGEGSARDLRDFLGGRTAAATRLSAYVRGTASSAPYRAEAIEVLGTCGKEGVDTVVGFADDESAAIRAAVAWALGNPATASRQTLSILTRYLRDSSADVRTRAAAALGRLGEKGAPALTALTEAFDDPSEGVRAVAVESVGEICHATGRHPDNILRSVILALRNESGYVRGAAASSLGRIGAGDVDAVGGLTTALNDRQIIVRKRAVKSLLQIATQKRMTEINIVQGLAFRQMRQRLVGFSCPIRRQDKAWDSVLTAAGSDQFMVRLIAALLLGANAPTDARVGAMLQRMLADEDADVRWAAVGSLGERVCSPEDVAALRAALKDKDEYVQEAAREVLAEIKKAQQEKGKNDKRVKESTEPEREK